MNAALRTEGNTITHSALSSRSCGMSSGIFIISSITMPEFSRRSVSFSLSARAASMGAVVRATKIPRASSFLMSSFLLRSGAWSEPGWAPPLSYGLPHLRATRATPPPENFKRLYTARKDCESTFASCSGNPVDYNRFSFANSHGSGSMALNRRSHALLIGCEVSGMVVCLRVAHTPAQSPPSKPAGSRARAANSKPVVREDVERFRERAEAALSAAGPDKGTWGVLITDAATGEVLYARNAAGYFMPASNAKLFSTALALATLGPDYRVRTTVASSGTVDANGVLNGNLVLIGRGDANLSNRKFPFDKKEERDGPPDKILAELADAVAARGVKEVTGDVIADDSMFQHEQFPSGWLVDDILWSYGAAVSAIAVNDNTFTLDLRPGAHEGDSARYDAGLAADF